MQSIGNKFALTLPAPTFDKSNLCCRYPSSKEQCYQHADSIHIDDDDAASSVYSNKEGKDLVLTNGEYGVRAASIITNAPTKLARVYWKGCSDSEFTVEPLSHLHNAPKRLNEAQEKYRIKCNRLYEEQDHSRIKKLEMKSERRRMPGKFSLQNKKPPQLQLKVRVGSNIITAMHNALLFFGF